jgi:hypothetical protein
MITLIWIKKKPALLQNYVRVIQTHLPILLKYIGDEWPGGACADMGARHDWEFIKFINLSIYQISKETIFLIMINIVLQQHRVGE